MSVWTAALVVIVVIILFCVFLHYNPAIYDKLAQFIINKPPAQPIPLALAQPMTQQPTQSTAQPITQTTAQTVTQTAAQAVVAQAPITQEIVAHITAQAPAIATATVTAPVTPVTTTIMTPITVPTVVPVPVVAPVVTSVPIVVPVYVPTVAQQLMASASLYGIREEGGAYEPVVLELTSDLQKGVLTQKGTMNSAMYGQIGVSVNAVDSIQLTLVEEGKVFTGTVVNGVAQLVSGAEKLTLFNNEKNQYAVPRQLDGLFIYQCKRYFMGLDRVFVQDDKFAATGSDDFGWFLLYGTIVTKLNGQELSLSKRYFGYTQSDVGCKLLYNKGIAIGQWFRVGRDEWAEMRLYEKGFIYNDAVPLYGLGCVPPATWFGTFTIEGQPFPGDLAKLEFKGNNFTALSLDPFGPANITGTLLVDKFTATKKYIGQTLQADMQGTITMNQFKGTCKTNTNISSTFDFAPK